MEELSNLRGSEVDWLNGKGEMAVGGRVQLVVYMLSGVIKICIRRLISPCRKH